MTNGQNTIAGQALRGYLERIERLRAEKKALAEDEKVVFAEAKAAGFSTKTIRSVLKVREMKPHDWQEAKQLLDMYLHAAGMATETPLFRAAGLMSVDTAAREQVLNAFRLFVPAEGEVILKMGGQPVRMWRDKAGEAHVEDWVEPVFTAKSETGGDPQAAAARPSKPVPACTEDEAEALGAEAARNNQPIIDNPFPWDDPRRARFDLGWRRETGSDGMGPEEGH